MYPKLIPLEVGTLLIPDDFFNLWTQITFFEDARAHIVPAFNETLRKDIISKLQTANIPCVTTGTYVQTTGPRFETKSEVRFLGTVADVVGKIIILKYIHASYVDNVIIVFEIHVFRNFQIFIASQCSISPLVWILQKIIYFPHTHLFILPRNDCSF